ncbi:hypothetical protein [Listeria monocytogenes]|uniref:hypothetical protein n=1 Tax=Listeria monocytogenes TaxID=1639 RepID=UPI0017CD2D1C|nr:hypothetical protein [Listeria monocytogenes]MBM9494031.1 hypothetical protein [Listeria monocytogenes]MBM9540360.1 hypothetical protein [Listeria monocytogenes]MBM9543829.1 hypothetical protein [Listeria monocytogenes]MBM9587118.1 hypothetical protein [Listeria monocytogenes]MBM9601575.1 hypothetical protein [Listeria monocytogenes]
MAVSEKEEYVNRTEFEKHKRKIYEKVNSTEDKASKALLTAEEVKTRQHQTEVAIAGMNPTLKSIDKQMERFISKFESTEEKVQEHEVKFADMGYESKAVLVKKGEEKSEAASKLSFWGIVLPVLGAIIVAVISILPSFFK